jgi:type IV fimbrial biogenesis protein FimT
MSFIDSDGNRQPESDADILRASDAPAAKTLFLPSSRPFLRYQADGRAANSNLTVYLCEDTEYAGMVVVNNLGRVRTERASTTGKPCPRD